MDGNPRFASVLRFGEREGLLLAARRKLPRLDWDTIKPEVVNGKVFIDGKEIEGLTRVSSPRMWYDLKFGVYLTQRELESLPCRTELFVNNHTFFFTKEKPTLELGITKTVQEFVDTVDPFQSLDIEDNENGLVTGMLWQGGSKLSGAIFTFKELTSVDAAYKIECGSVQPLKSLRDAINAELADKGTSSKMGRWGETDVIFSLWKKPSAMSFSANRPGYGRVEFEAREVRQVLNVAPKI